MLLCSLMLSDGWFAFAFGPEIVPAVLGALAVGITLGMLGSGGSILAVPVLIFVVGHPEKQAIVETLVIVGVIAASGVVQRARSGDVAWGAVGAFAPSSMLGAMGGSSLANFVSGNVQVIVLACVMLASALLTLRSGSGSGGRGDGEASGNERKRRLFAIACAGLGVGLLTGLVGVGGGFLIVPALLVFVGLAPGAAVGASLAIIALNCSIGFATYALTHDETGADWRVIALFAILGIAGSMVGQRIGGKLNQRAFKRVFAVFLLVIAPAMILWQMTRSSGGDSGGAVTLRDSQDADRADESAQDDDRGDR